jgi:Flp pilus assembly protein TadG
MRTRGFPSRRQKSPGQSLVEFALILPIVLTIMGAAVDMARLYGAWVALEGATRDAAEQVASDPTLTSSSLASARAQVVICSQMTKIVGYVAPVGDPTHCSQPALTLTWANPSINPAVGASEKYPIGSATVTATLPFRMLFAYPFVTQNGAWNITSTQAYTIVQNR